MPLYTNTTAGTVSYAPGTRSTKLLTADSSRTSNNTLAEESGLTIKLGKNQRIAFRYNIFYTTTANADFQFLVNIPADFNYYRLARIGVKHDGAEISEAPVTTEGSAFSIEVSGTEGYLGLEGVLENGATNDNLKFTWAQKTSHGDTTSVTRGSSIEYIMF